MDLKKIIALDPTKKAFELLTEFKKFARKGKVIDLTVGVTIGAGLRRSCQLLGREPFHAPGRAQPVGRQGCAHFRCARPH
jgi:hypothetical protein